MNSPISSRVLLAAAVLATVAAKSTALAQQTLYVSEYAGGVVSKITGPGSVTTFASGLVNPAGLDFHAGSGTLYGVVPGMSLFAYYTPAGVLGGLMGGLPNSNGMAVDQAGYSYFGSGNTLYKFSGGGAVQASISIGSPIFDVAVDAAGDIYATAGGNVIKLPSNLSSSSVYLSGGSLSSGLTGLAFDSQGNLYVDDVGNSRVQKFSPSGSDLGTYINTPAVSWGLAFDNTDTLFVASFGSGEILQVPVGGGSSSVYASGLNSPIFIAIDPASGSPVPEPSTWAAVGFLGLIGGMTAWRRVKVSKNA